MFILQKKKFTTKQKKAFLVVQKWTTWAQTYPESLTGRSQLPLAPSRSSSSVHPPLLQAGNNKPRASTTRQAYPTCRRASPSVATYPSHPTALLRP